MRFFRRKNKESLSKRQGVPDGTFRCDVCKLVQPSICICGAVADASDDPPRVYTICGICAIWLGFGKFRFSQGLRFNLSEEEREKIRALHKELDIVKEHMEELLHLKLGSEAPEVIHEFLEQVPNHTEFIRLRSSLLPENIIDLSARLTSGEFVDPSEIAKINKG